MSYPYISYDEASKKLSVSLKTVYNYVTKSQGQVRVSKAYGKSFVNFEDLQSYITKDYKTLQNDYKVEPSKEQVLDQGIVTSSMEKPEKYIWWTDIWNDNALSWKSWNKPLQNLQNDYKITNEKIEQLEKFNSNLQDQANKYAIKLNEEKEEKRAIQQKYDSLEGEYRNKIEEYADYRVRTTKFSSFYIWLVAVTLLCLLALLYLYIRQLYIF